MLTESDDGGSDVCLVVPDITKSDFSTFHAALFAAEKDVSLNAYIVIRTAEIFGIDFVSSSQFCPHRLSSQSIKRLP